MSALSDVAPRVAARVHLLYAGMLALALICGWWAVGRGVEYARTALSYPAPLDGQEGMALWEASLLRQGHGLYVPVVPENFVSAPYPPVHPLLMALVGGADGPHVFWAGRLVSLVAALVVAVCAFGLVRRVAGSALAGLAAVTLVLAFTPLQLWALRIKPDVLGLMFTVAGLWLTAGTAPRGGDNPVDPSFNRGRVLLGLPPRLLLAALAFVLAHFTKQTMLAGPLAAGTYLLLIDRRTAVRWGAFYLVTLALCWVTLDFATHGQYTMHVWVLHRLPWAYQQAWDLTWQLRDAWPLLLLALIGLVISWRRPSVISAYLLWAPASLIGGGVTGAHHNHLLETGLALALAGGQAVGLALRCPGFTQALAPVLLATQLWLWREPLPWFAGEFHPDPEYARYIEFIQATPGEVMADDVALLYAAGRPLRYDDPAAMGPASALGLWDASQFIADIRARRFSAILLPVNVFDDGLIDPSHRWTPEMLAAVRDAYTIKFRDTLLIYVPNE